MHKNMPIWRDVKVVLPPENVLVWAKFNGQEFAHMKFSRVGDVWRSEIGDVARTPSHWRYSASIKFEHRRLEPLEFVALLEKSTLSMNDFLYISGRRRDQLEQFIRGDSRGFAPTMGDALILELATMHDDNVDDMMEIADRYAIGPTERRS